MYPGDGSRILMIIVIIFVTIFHNRGAPTEQRPIQEPNRSDTCTKEEESAGQLTISGTFIAHITA